MKDRLIVLATGLALSMIAWAFCHYLGKDTFSVLPTVMFIIVLADNVRLRRQLRSIASVWRNSPK
jgi:hypothetical protein